jgi:hypothetical protein
VRIGPYRESGVIAAVSFLRQGLKFSLACQWSFAAQATVDRLAGTYSCVCVCVCAHAAAEDKFTRYQYMFVVHTRNVVNGLYSFCGKNAREREEEENKERERKECRLPVEANVMGHG